jgi:hypothetical protein
MVSASPLAEFTPLAHARMIRRKLERDRSQLSFTHRGGDNQAKQRELDAALESLTIIETALREADQA